MRRLGLRIAVERRKVMRKRILLVVIFAVIAGTAGYGVRTAYNSTIKKQKAGYTIVWQVTEYFPDGTSIPVNTETRYVSANGNWHAFKTTGNKTEESYGAVGKGTFVKHAGKLFFVSDYSNPSPAVTEDDLMNNPDFLRVDSVLGYKAIVVSSGNRPRTGSEFYKVPALGGEIIKTVIAQSGTGPRIVYEPVSLILGEPHAEAVTLPTDLTVDYDTVKAKRMAGAPKSSK
jgi:hypothetical protein